MSGYDCDGLADYLEKALAADEMREFTQHLTHCPRCQQAVEEARQLEQLLEQASVYGAPVPAGLVDRIDWQLNAARRRRLAAWTASLAATVLLGIGAAAWLMRTPPERFAEPRMTDIVPAPAETVHVAPPQVEVTVTSGDEVIAVPLPSRNPNVTILWTFPARQTAARGKLSPPIPTNLSDGSGL